MANQTDEAALHTLGTDPQTFLSPITRTAIQTSPFWNHTLFGTNVADIALLSSTLSHIGGTHGPNLAPTPFLCMLLKLLQLFPYHPEIQVFLHQHHFKYSRMLAAFYVRLVEKPKRVYEILEDLLSDYDKIVVREGNAYVIAYVDEIVERLLWEPEVLGIALPRLPPRALLEETAGLKKRVSELKL